MVQDLILDQNHVPELDEISHYMDDQGRSLWLEMGMFMKMTFGASPSLQYSKCSGKPGWNVKYKRSSKSYCTLYPEKWGFTTLIVLPEQLVPIVTSLNHPFDQKIKSQLQDTKPLNGTIWMMLPVETSDLLSDVKQLLSLKYKKKA